MALFLDIRNTFNNDPWNRILTMLTEIRISEDTRRILRSYVKDFGSRVECLKGVLGQPLGISSSTGRLARAFRGAEATKIVHFCL
jgi:hypothetical protein